MIHRYTITQAGRDAAYALTWPGMMAALRTMRHESDDPLALAAHRSADARRQAVAWVTPGGLGTYQGAENWPAGLVRE